MKVVHYQKLELGCHRVAIPCDGEIVDILCVGNEIRVYYATDTDLCHMAKWGINFLVVGTGMEFDDELYKEYVPWTSVVDSAGRMSPLVWHVFMKLEDLAKIGA